MPRLRIETLSESNRDLVARFEHSGSSVTVFNITLDVGVPTILSVLQSQSPEAPAFVFAASAEVDPEHAVRKSLEELAHTRRLARSLKTTRSCFVPAPTYDNVVDQDDHVHLYCDHAHTPLADFLFASDRRIGFDEINNLATGDPQQDLEALLKKVRSVNHRVLITDLTTPDVRGLGLRVVRAVIPGFHPLFIGHEIRALGGSRLWEVPQKLGYKGITRESGDNPAPHPYP
jgi:ribosomal protein S12 methylthiotransferase accessory factor